MPGWWERAPQHPRLGSLREAGQGEQSWGTGRALDREKSPGKWTENWAKRRVLVTAFPCWFSPQLGFNIRGGKASQLGIFISKVIPDSDAHRAGLQEGDQVLSVNDVDFQDIEHSKAVEILKTAREITMRVRYFPYNYQRQKERTVH
nr:PDZ domain-containing protein 11 [Zonotrichia albicollis]